MIDSDLVAKKLALIETCVEQLNGGRLPPALATSLRDMAGFRNVLVHGYQDVDLGIVEDVLTHLLGDLVAFVASVRSG